MKEKIGCRVGPALWVTVLLLAGAPAIAAGAGDGCETLAQAVTLGVGDALGSGFRETYRRPPAPEVVRSCGSTAATVSGAYAATLATFGIDVDWNDGMPGNPGDVCLSHHLEQCYPEIGAGSAWLAGDPKLVVDASWAAVTAAVVRYMPLGAGSDISWFGASSLSETLAVSIRATLAVPVQAKVRSE